jgi:hypothetical protein
MATPQQIAAKKLVDEFSRRTTPGVFPHFSRADVASQVRDRIDAPGKIDQLSSSLCGPASLVYHVARDFPEKYAQFVIDLYEKGKAAIGKFSIEPGTDMKNYAPSKADIAAADWIALASIRDSKNWFFDYQSVKDEVAGITMPSSLESWFKDAGYTDIRNETNVYFTKDQKCAETASDLWGKAYKVCLFIGANMLEVSTQDEGTTTPDHWVVLNSAIKFTHKDASFSIYTWGDPGRLVPQKGSLSIESFLKNFYGFVACKL